MTPTDSAVVRDKHHDGILEAIVRLQIIEEPAKIDIILLHRVVILLGPPAEFVSGRLIRRPEINKRQRGVFLVLQTEPEDFLVVFGVPVVIHRRLVEKISDPVPGVAGVELRIGIGPAGQVEDVGEAPVLGQEGARQIRGLAPGGAETVKLRAGPREDRLPVQSTARGEDAALFECPSTPVTKTAEVRELIPLDIVPAETVVADEDHMLGPNRGFDEILRRGGTCHRQKRKYRRGQKRFEGKTFYH